MTLFLLTCGTSVAGGPKRGDENSDAYRTRITAKLQKERSEQHLNEEFLVRAAAEVHALVRAKIGSKDEVVFLSSETEDGRICAESLVALVEREFDCRAKFVEVKGLQVTDGRRFRSIGIGSLFAAIEQQTRDRARGEIQLNATGGFKGTVPYIVLYGMFTGIPVSYVYEFSNTLITLPPFAVEFDWERIVPAEEAIFTLFKDGPLPKEGWRKLMPVDYEADADRYDALFEFEDGLVGLSAVGHLMKARLEAAESEADVLLSPSASTAWRVSSGGVRAHFDSILRRVCNPLHRVSGKHAESLHKTDLKVWKVYGSAGPRMLYWIEVDRIFVGELFAHHDEYEQYVDNAPLRRRDYDQAAFTKFDSGRPPDYDTILQDIRLAHTEPIDLRRALEDELRNTKIEFQRVRTQHNAQLKKSREHAENRGIALGRKAAEAKADEQLRFMQHQQDEMHGAFAAKLNERDVEIAQLKADVAKLKLTIENVEPNVLLTSNKPKTSP